MNENSLEKKALLKYDIKPTIKCAVCTLRSSTKSLKNLEKMPGSNDNQGNICDIKGSNNSSPEISVQKCSKDFLMNDLNDQISDDEKSDFSEILLLKRIVDKSISSDKNFSNIDRKQTYLPNDCNKLSKHSESFNLKHCSINKENLHRCRSENNLKCPSNGCPPVDFLNNMSLNCKTHPLENYSAENLVNVTINTTFQLRKSLKELATNNCEVCTNLQNNTNEKVKDNFEYPNKNKDISSESSDSLHVQFQPSFCISDESIEEPLLHVGENVTQINFDNQKHQNKKNISSSSNQYLYNFSRKFYKRRFRMNSTSSTASSVSSSSSDSSDSRQTEFERRAPDGGWGWVVVFAAFMIHCIADGVTMSFGILYAEFLSYFKESRSMTSLIGSLFMAIPLLGGPLASLLTDRYGCRSVTICGSVIACIGFLMSAFAQSIFYLYFTIGLITGLGLAICYVAAIVIVAFYFEKRRSFAIGIAVAGSGIGTFIFAPLIQWLLNNYAWRGCMIILAGIFLNMAVCGCVMQDLEWKKRTADNDRLSAHTSTSHQIDSATSSDSISNKKFSKNTVIPPVDEIKRKLQDGAYIISLSPLAEGKYDAAVRSGSLVLLPTYLNKSEISKDFFPAIPSGSNAYEVVSQMYPQFLSYPATPHQTCKPEEQFFSPVSSIRSDTEEESTEKHVPNVEVISSLQSSVYIVINRTNDENECHQLDTISSEKILEDSTTKLENGNILKHSLKDLENGQNLKQSTTHHEGYKHSHRISCMAPNLNTHAAAPLQNMRVPRQSMTFRGAMLNTHRYRLRASSCPDIYKNSIITIAKRKKNAWTYLDDFKEIMTSCCDMNYCLCPGFLIFAASNFILYAFYDTVYMYLTDYAHGVGVSHDESANLVSAIGILNCVGMVIMGYIGDRPWCSAILVYNICMVICGLSVILMPFLEQYWFLAIASAIFGLFISANYALTAVILVELISLEAFSKSYGFLLLIQGIGNLAGPPLVGLLADATGGYTIPFVVSGAFIILSGVMLAVIEPIERCRKSSRSTSPDSRQDSNDSKI